MDKTQTSLSKILFPEQHVSAAILKLLDEGIIESRRLLNEATEMYEQSKIELTNAVRRNSAVTAQIQKMQADLDGISKADLQQVYSAALDSQQKLLVMRGQSDKLNREISLLTDSVKTLETISIMIRESADSGFGYEVKDSGAILQMVIDAQEEERHRLSQQLHDGPAQVLSNLIIQAEITQKYYDMDTEVARRELNILKSTVVHTFQMIRDFIYQLHPMMLDDLGFFPTVKRYIENFKEQTGVQTTLNIHGVEKRLEQYLETMLFRAVQELLQNAYQYNIDNLGLLKINVEIIIDDQNLSLYVKDNGRGFDAEKAGKNGGMGLKLIRERVEVMNGTFAVESSPNRGCAVRLAVPYLEVVNTLAITK
jgi:two-component system sensor histidine kinase DegS